MVKKRYFSLSQGNIQIAPPPSPPPSHMMCAERVVGFVQVVQPPLQAPAAHAGCQVGVSIGLAGFAWLAGGGVNGALGCALAAVECEGRETLRFWDSTSTWLDVP